MTLDARQSLTAVASVTLFIGLFLASLKLPKIIDIPDWVVNRAGFAGGSNS